MKLYFSNTRRDGSLALVDLQDDINSLTATSESWGLKMNVTKCKCLRFGPRTLVDCGNGDSPYTINGAAIGFSSIHKDLGVKTDRKLKFHEHIRAKANTCNGITTNILSSTLCRNADFIMAIFKALIRPKLEYGSTLWNLGYLGDIRSLERVQRRWTRQISGLENLPYNERLRRLDLFSIQGRLLRADLITTWKIFAGQCAVQVAGIFTVDSSSRRGHSRKLFLPRACREVRQRFFAVRVVRDWNSLSEEAVSAPTLNQFKYFLHRDLGQRLYEYIE